jgi:AraC-like DNA-binding protein
MIQVSNHFEMLEATRVDQPAPFTASEWEQMDRNRQVEAIQLLVERVDIGADDHSSAVERDCGRHPRRFDVRRSFVVHDLATLGDQHPVRRTETCRGQLVVGIAPGVDVLRYRLGDARRLLLEARLELLFGGVGPGELFVARNAGNMVDTATMGTVEYGSEHLGSPLIVVLGHERCGAVVAACEVATKNTKLPGSIGPMVKPIVPAAMAMKGKPGDFVDNTVRDLLGCINPLPSGTCILLGLAPDSTYGDAAAAITSSLCAKPDAA